ncbi:MAG: hypothetical protein ACFE0J_10495 [Elainellaceae cyanobacterium]
MSHPPQPQEPQANGFLTVEESAKVDTALLSSREKFSTRVAIYSLRVLKQIAQQERKAIAQISREQIIDWVEHDKSVSTNMAQGLKTDDSFRSFFTQLVLSSLKPLKQISQETGISLEDLTIDQVIAWFEKEAKIRVEQGQDATFLK